MCGISGILSYKELSSNEVERLKNCQAKLRHRGPDSQGFYSDSDIALAHNRLSILDLSQTGNQPISDTNKRYVLVYNGECYNYEELKQLLIKDGEVIQSSGDTEVVLKILIRKGLEGLKLINGFFSLALYDKEKNELLLARDRFGIKPLYLSHSVNGIMFSSEMRGIMEMGDEFTLNRNSLSAFLHLNYIPSPHAIFNEVEKMEAGHYHIYDKKGRKTNGRFYDLEKEKKSALYHTSKQLSDLIEQAVEKRLVSDVPIGSFLSGGLDSSIITAFASKHKSSLKTFNMSFKDNKQYDESSDAELVAKHLNTSHTTLEINENDLLASIPEILNHVDEPFADSSSIAMYNLCKAAGQEIKVALSGDGGDELFAGYYKHRAMYFSFKYPYLSKMLSLGNPIFKNLPQSRKSGILNSIRKVQRYSSVAGKDGNERYWNWAGFGHQKQSELFQNIDFNSTSFLKSCIGNDVKSFEDGLDADIKMVLEGDMLVKADRNSMAHGLEVRVPLLDHHLVNAISGLEPNHKINNNKGKIIMRRIAEDLLPRKILDKPKQGFEVPLKKWLNHDLEDQVNKLLSKELIEDQGLFDSSTVDKIKLSLKQKASGNSEYAIWNLMTFNQWWLNYHHKIKS